MITTELYRNAEGCEVWRIFEDRPDGFLILAENVASDYDAAYLKRYYEVERDLTISDHCRAPGRRAAAH